MGLKGINIAALSPTEDIARLEQNIGLNSLRDAVNGGWSNMIDGVADVFTDETGVNTGGATNANYDAAGDYYTSTVAADPATLLIHSDTTNGSTTFVDSVDSKTITAVGDTQHDTSTAQFGASSIAFDGTGDNLSLADSEDWNLGATFTIDFWADLDVLGDDVFFNCGDFFSGNTDLGFMFQVVTATRMDFHYSTNGTTDTNRVFSVSGISTGTWAHIALVATGGTIELYINGVSQGTGVYAAHNNSSSPLLIGTDTGGTRRLNGNIDEFRIVKGTAVWTEAFTPPAAPYVGASSGNMILPSDEFTTLATPASGRLVVLYDPIDAVTLNTDLIFECSRDGGTTWTAWTLEANALFAGTVEILTSEDLDISAQPVGSTTIIWRATTANTKNVQIHGVYLQWR